MENTAKFSDHTVNMAIQLRLPTSEIELMCTILQKYSVSCYDITLKSIQQYLETAELLVNPLMRCCINATVNDVVSSRCFQQICINWNHKKENNLHVLYESASAAGNCELYVSIENAQELEMKEFEPYFAFARQCSARGMIYCCDGTEDVFELYERLSFIVKNSPCPIEFQSINQLGLATAQTLSALKAGVCRVGTSAVGIGGYTPLEEVLMAVKHLWHYEVFAGNEIAKDFQTILSAMGMTVPPRKALIGSDVFAHESGIHVDGIHKNPLLYEIIKPEDVGLMRKLVIGKHSGTASLKIKYLQWDIQLSQEEAAFLLTKVRELAQFQKHSLSDKQVANLYDIYIAKGRVSHECCKTI